MTMSTEDRDLLWQQYSLNVDLYKFYLDLVVKINIFYYAITGAILTYYSAQADSNLFRLALGLPVLFSLVIGVLFFIGAKLLVVVRTEQFNIRDRLRLETAPEFGVLMYLLYASGGLMFIVGFALLGIIICHRP